MTASLIRTILICQLISILCSCSGLERSEQEKLRRQNCKAEYIYRGPSDIFYPIGTPEHTARTPYPWETEAHLPRITKEFFRCKGNPLNVSLLDASNPEQPTPLADCDSTHHGLPIFSNKEGVYPVLPELLNYLQKKTGRRVIITCGHRCPVHNLYADPSKDNRASKHQIGAEVDFYIQGMEDQPLEVIGLLMQYYQEHPSFKSHKDWTTFQRYDKADAHTAVQPWFNKEIFIKLYQKEEGRDIDNHHPYPYLSIQVRFDRDKKEKVLFDYEKATKGYPRT
ncbi:MAG: hypothetical protein KGJ02_08120 [Verrucomicrobiota bacterium]|nr:hypothetical protein [Verrucomicrobiota bacterium]